jgi:hypothetical protein
MEAGSHANHVLMVKIMPVRFIGTKSVRFGFRETKTKDCKFITGMVVWGCLDHGSNPAKTIPTNGTYTWAKQPDNGRVILLLLPGSARTALKSNKWIYIGANDHVF